MKRIQGSRDLGWSGQARGSRGRLLCGKREGNDRPFSCGEDSVEDRSQTSRICAKT